MSIFIRTVPNVMRHYGCTADDAARFIDLREEGYSTNQAALMAGLSDPPEDSPSASSALAQGATTVSPARQERGHMNKPHPSRRAG